MKVMKFGGGCLKDAHWFLKIGGILQAEKEPSALVVSAVHGITDILIEGIILAKKSEKNIPTIIKK